MKKILVPCDFSIPAINAFRFALDTAVKSKGTVYLLYVVELPVLHDTVIMPVMYFEEQYLKDVKAATEKRFSKLITKYNVEGVKVVTHVEYGTAVKTILNYSLEKSIDLVIMGSHGASGWKEIFIGSNAEKIVRSSAVPVLIVKDFFKGVISNIIFPNSLEETNQEDLAMKVKALQEFFKAHLFIVWINTPVTFTTDTVTYERLEAFAKRYMFKNYTLDVFNHVSKEEGIIKYSQMVKGNIIALGTEGRKGIEHFMNGSVAEDVVNHSRCLIWTSIVHKKKKLN